MSDRKESKSSRLYYHNTRQEVQLGDHVKIKRWFKRDEEGIVYYIPGISHRHEELEYDDVRQWAIKTNEGTVYPILYDPINFQPPKHIVFLSRGQADTLKPIEQTTNQDEE